LYVTATLYSELSGTGDSSYDAFMCRAIDHLPVSTDFKVMADTDG
jgi:hypothetical protein